MLAGEIARGIAGASVAPDDFVAEIRLAKDAIQ